MAGAGKKRYTWTLDKRLEALQYLIDHHDDLPPVRIIVHKVAKLKLIQTHVFFNWFITICRYSDVVFCSSLGKNLHHWNRKHGCSYNFEI